MKLPEPERKEPEENVVPLINIVFLLLIFFMVAGTLTATDPFEVDAPQAESGEERFDEPLQILLGTDDRYALDGEEMDREALLGEVKAVMSEQPGRQVEVKTDARLATSRFLDFTEALRDVGVERVLLVTEFEG